MAVPKFKKSRSNTRSRRSTWKTQAVSLTNCKKCKSPILPHTACPICGDYKGKRYDESIRKEFAKLQ